MSPTYATTFLNYALRTSFKQEEIKVASSVDEKSTNKLKLEVLRINNQMIRMPKQSKPEK